MLKRTRNLILAALGGLCAFALVYSWESIQAVKLGYSIEKLRREIRDIESSNTYLKKEIQASLSPEKLEERALRLGMVYPEPQAVILMDTAHSNEPARAWLAKVFN